MKISFKNSNENMREKHFWKIIGKDLLDMTLKLLYMKEKLMNWTSSKFQNFCFLNFKIKYKLQIDRKYFKSRISERTCILNL